MPRRLLVPAILAALAGCSDEPAAPKPEPEAPLSRDLFAPLGEPVPFATKQQRADFERGRELVAKVFTEAEGLGPKINTVSCGGCHQKPLFGGTSGRYRNFYQLGSRTEDGHFLPAPGNGISHGYGLGTDVPVRPPIPAQFDITAQRVALPFFGAGLIGEIPAEVIQAGEDPDDADGDGISGRVNLEKGIVARFGRKAQTANLEGFVRGPLEDHLGLTTDPLTREQKARLLVPYTYTLGSDFGGLTSVEQGLITPLDKPMVDYDEYPDPELSGEDLYAMVSFVMLLAPPAPDEPTTQTLHGKDLFGQLGCSACHSPALEGPRGPIPLYSDLLLHDMGPELADGVEEWNSTGSEFRTQPLWGLGAYNSFLHDGRADSLEEAIRWHGGEGAAARERFDALAAADQADVIAFLRSLGGASYASEGLLLPGTPVPEVGTPGGPIRALGADEEARFLEGRRLFDRDTKLSEGLGSPFFNADSCRSCHNQPAIGGAGTLDVTVVRAGKWFGDAFGSPTPDGTILPRLSTPWMPRLEANYDEVERRKSPSSLGLGLVESIPEAVIVANADPDDADGDGIRGRVSRLPDGRLGRLGWKADVPDLAEFVRDAHSHELGFTIGAAEGLSYGVATDDDGVADPELAADTLDAMTFFLQQLAPLAPTADEPEGRVIFSQIGCNSCHAPELGGVPLYSDLLLHDVAPAEYRGIPTATTEGREFRTPPLWGLSRTGPWMHDAGAPTIEEAIHRHDGEALGVRQKFEALSEADRAALLRFLGAL